MSPAYGASKAGLVGWVKSVAPDLASRGVRINVVHPGPFDTPLSQRMGGQPLTAFSRFGQPEELAGTVLALLGSATSFVTGTEVTVDGGHLLCPPSPSH